MKLGPFKGMNNLAEDHALPNGTKEDPRAAVRNAVNVDFDNAGKPRLRLGMVKKYPGIAMAGGFCCSQGMFIVDSGMLKKVNTSTWVSSTVLTGITGETFAFYEFNGVLYFSDGTKTAKLIGGVASNWGMDNPSSPVLYTVSGLLGAGLYQCCLTYVDAAGKESGASDIVDITISDNRGIVFANIPSSLDPQVVATRLYMTTANGNIFYQCGEISHGENSYSVLLPSDSGKVLGTLFMTKPPAGQIIREHNGRLVIAKGKVLYFGEEYSPDIVSQLPKYKFIFISDISVVESVDGGIWVVADKTYFMAGSGPSDFIQQVKLEYGAAIGTGKKLPDNENVAWFSDRGQIVASNGELKNIQEDQVAPDYGTTGATLISERNGIKQAITVVKNATMSPRANKDFITAETARRS